MNKKRWLALGVFIVLLVAYMVSSVGKVKEGPQATNALNKYFNGTESKWATKVYKEGSGQKLALIKVEGIITATDSANTGFTNKDTYNHHNFLQQIEAAFADPQIKGVILQVNSPGGGVYESDEAYHKLMELKAKYNKPVVVYMGQQAASGGYYISMAADKIYANNNTITGSIGVIMSTLNFTELANKIGIQDVTFKSASNKDLLNPLRPVTNDEQAIMQGLIMETYNRFVDVVAQGRNMDRQRVLELADGRIYSGAQAQSLGLVDEIGYEENAIEGAAKLANTSDPQVILYQNENNLFTDLFSNMRSPAIDLNGLSKQIQQQRAPQIMYISN